MYASTSVLGRRISSASSDSGFGVLARSLFEAGAGVFLARTVIAVDLSCKGFSADANSR